MIQLVYISTARPGTIEDGCAGLIEQARHRNLAAGVTGVLLFTGERFLQVLEGERAVVEALFRRIVVDPRHRAVLRLTCRPIAARECGDWSMRFIDDGAPMPLTVAPAGLSAARVADAITGYRAFVPA